MYKYKRIFLIVLDSVGIGYMKDAYKYGDLGANTLLHTIELTKKRLPNLEKMGLLNLIYDKEIISDSYYAKAETLSNGKDTLTGHLEMMGIETKEPLKTFTKTGFPKELIKEIEEKCNRKVIGNISASGTEIINKLGEEHIKTGNIIVYTSADSVLQIAAHEDVVKLPELYNICKIVREITLKDEYKVGRIIARPFIGTKNNFQRTGNRHDFALDPPSKTYLDVLKENNLDVLAIGKISDVFNSCGITKSTKTNNNFEGIEKIISSFDEDFTGLCFANLNDFDSKYGHRRDPFGYMDALIEVDNNILNIKSKMGGDDLLIITADHGCDPIYHGTDHTREFVPVLVYNPNFKEPKRLNDLKTLSDIGATIVNNFNLEYKMGTSFLEKLK